MKTIVKSHSNIRNELGYKLVEKLLSDHNTREEKEKKKPHVLRSALESELKDRILY
jgi:hypothetical protein